MLNHDLSRALPAYDGGSIVNLMASFGARFGAIPTGYAPLALLDPARLAAARRIALVVIDGLGAELFDHLGGNSALARLRAGDMTSVYPPTTASAVTTYLSGQAPQQHGLTGWFMHFRRLGAVTAVLPFMPRYGHAPLGAVGITPADLIDAHSFAATLDAPAAALLPADLTESAFSRLLGAGARRDGYRDLGDFAQRLAHWCGGGDDTEYLYAYWPKLDTLSHLHGPGSSEVATHFRALDAALAPLAEIAATHGTLLVISADHGFIASGPEQRIDVEDHRELAAMLSLPLCGEPRSAFAYVRANCARAFEDYVSHELAHAVDLQPAEALIEAGWFGHGRAHAELAARLGDYVMVMRDNYTIRDRIVGERDMTLYGVHGGHSRAEQIVPLLLAGP